MHTNVAGWSGFGRTNNRAGRNFCLTAEMTQSLFGVYSSATVLQQACSPPIVNNLKPFSLYFCWNAFGSRGSAPDHAGGLAARPRPPTGSFVFISAGPIIYCLLRTLIHRHRKAWLGIGIALVACECAISARHLEKTSGAKEKFATFIDLFTVPRPS